MNQNELLKFIITKFNLSISSESDEEKIKNAFNIFEEIAVYRLNKYLGTDFETFSENLKTLKSYARKKLGKSASDDFYFRNESRIFRFNLYRNQIIHGKHANRDTKGYMVIKDVYKLVYEHILELISIEYSIKIPEDLEDFDKNKLKHLLNFLIEYSAQNNIIEVKTDKSTLTVDSAIKTQSPRPRIRKIKTHPLAGPSPQIKVLSVEEITEKFKNDFETSILALNEAISSLSPNVPDEYFIERGHMRREIGDIEGGIEDYTTAINNNPDISLYYLFRGHANCELNLGKEAIENYTIAILKATNKLDKANAYHWRGVVKLDYLHDYEKSLYDFNKAIEIDSDINSYFKRGEAHCVLKNYENSKKDFLYALELDPENGIAFIGIGNAKLGLEDYNGALEEFDKALSLDDKLEKAYIGKGKVYYELEKYEEAVEIFTKAIKINPKSFSGYFRRADSHKVLQRFKEEIEDYNQLINIGHNSALFYFLRGKAKYNMEDYIGALNDANRAIEKEEVYSYYILRGNAKYKLDDEKGADQDYAKSDLLRDS